MSATACCRDGGGQEKIEDTEGNASQRIDQHHRHDAKAQKRAPWHALELQLCGSLTSRVVRKRGWSIYHSGPDPASVYRFPEIFLDASFVYLFICGEFRLQNHVLWSFSMQLIDRSMLLLLHSRSLSLSLAQCVCRFINSWWFSLWPRTLSWVLAFLDFFSVFLLEWLEKLAAKSRERKAHACRTTSDCGGCWCVGAYFWNPSSEAAVYGVVRRDWVPSLELAGLLDRHWCSWLNGKLRVLAAQQPPQIAWLRGSAAASYQGCCCDRPGGVDNRGTVSGEGEWSRGCAVEVSSPPWVLLQWVSSERLSIAAAHCCLSSEVWFDESLVDGCLLIPRIGCCRVGLSLTVNRMLVKLLYSESRLDSYSW